MDHFTNQQALITAVREVSGEEGLLRLIERKGGSHVRLPKRAFVGNWLAEIVGLDQAQKIIDRVTCYDADGRVIEFSVYVPLGESGQRARQFAIIRELDEQGVSRRDIASRLGISERTVQRITPKLIRGKMTSGLIKTRTNSKPRIGIFELLIIQGKSASTISARTGFSFKEIEGRRKRLKEAGLLDGSDPLHAKDPGPSAALPDHSANLGEMVSTPDEGTP